MGGNLEEWVQCVPLRRFFSGGKGSERSRGLVGGTREADSLPDVAFGGFVVRVGVVLSSLVASVGGHPRVDLLRVGFVDCFFSGPFGDAFFEVAVDDGLILGEDESGLGRESGKDIFSCLVVEGGAFDGVGFVESFALPFEASVDHPVEDPGGLTGEDVVEVAFRTAVEGFSPRYDFDAWPDAVVDAVDPGEVVGLEPEREVGHEFPFVFSHASGVDRVPSGEVLDLGFVESFGLSGFGGDRESLAE